MLDDDHHDNNDDDDDDNNDNNSMLKYRSVSHSEMSNLPIVSR